MNPKPYLTRAELAERVGRWTDRTISRLIERGVLVEGDHFFLDPAGRGYLFRWDRIVDLIESPERRSSVPAEIGEIRMLAGGTLGGVREQKGGVRGL